MKAPDGVIDIFLQPGDYYFGDESTRIRTILGSCVSITLWHPWKRIGGMCHFMLPQRAQRGDEFHGKYADEALELLLKQVRLHKTHPGDYQIKLFGGGDMFPGRPSRGGEYFAPQYPGCATVLRPVQHETHIGKCRRQWTPQCYF